MKGETTYIYGKYNIIIKLFFLTSDSRKDFTLSVRKVVLNISVFEPRINELNIRTIPKTMGPIKWLILQLIG